MVEYHYPKPPSERDNDTASLVPEGQSELQDWEKESSEEHFMHLTVELILRINQCDHREFQLRNKKKG